jgi:hypothetical protein
VGKTIGIVDILVAGKAAEHRLPKQGNQKVADSCPSGRPTERCRPTRSAQRRRQAPGSRADPHRR